LLSLEKEKKTSYFQVSAMNVLWGEGKNVVKERRRKEEKECYFKDL